MADEVEKQEDTPLEENSQEEAPQEEELTWSETPLDAPEAIPGEPVKKKKRFPFALMLVLVTAATAAASFLALVLLDMKNVSGEDVLRKTAAASKDPEKDPSQTQDPSKEPEKDPSQTQDPSKDPSQTQKPPEEPDPMQGGNMNTAETVEYLRKHKPSALGLPGDSMDVYKITSDRSTFVVDGNGDRILCKVLMVYQVDKEAGTNEFIGEYLVSCHNDHTIYRWNESTGEVTVVVPGNG